MEPTYRYYVLSYSDEGDRNYRSTGLWGVIAKDIVQAVYLCQQKKPKATIWSVSHHGIVHGLAPNLPSSLIVEE